MKNLFLTLSILNFCVWAPLVSTTNDPIIAPNRHESNKVISKVNPVNIPARYPSPAPVVSTIFAGVAIGIFILKILLFSFLYINMEPSDPFVIIIALICSRIFSSVNPDFSFICFISWAFPINISDFLIIFIRLSFWKSGGYLTRIKYCFYS